MSQATVGRITARREVSVAQPCMPLPPRRSLLCNACLLQPHIPVCCAPAESHALPQTWLAFAAEACSAAQCRRFVCWNAHLLRGNASSTPFQSRAAKCNRPLPKSRPRFCPPPFRRTVASKSMKLEMWKRWTASNIPSRFSSRPSHQVKGGNCCATFGTR